jgi:hypothetical protein
MRENRPYGSEGGEASAFPTPIRTCFKSLSRNSFLSAKDAKYAKKSEGSCQSDQRHGKPTQLGMLLPSLRP